MDALNVIVPEACAHLTPGGWLLVEHGYNQESAVRDLFVEQGYGQVITERDLAGQPRVTRGAVSG